MLIGTHARFTQRGRHGIPRHPYPVRAKFHWSTDRHREFPALSELPHKLQNIAARQRLAASNPHFRYAEIGADANDAQRFLESKNVCARQPFLQFLRHTVMATLVAAVRDRNPQIRNAMAVSIFHDAES